MDGATYNVTYAKEGYNTVTMENVDITAPMNTLLTEATYTAISDLRAAEGQVTYVNAMGQTSNRPFQGVNIVMQGGKAIGKVLK